jgi:hypothetical protein
VAAESEQCITETLNFEVENNPAFSERERRDSQQRHNEACKQRDLLLNRVQDRDA